MIERSEKNHFVLVWVIFLHSQFFFYDYVKITNKSLAVARKRCKSARKTTIRWRIGRIFFYFFYICFSALSCAPNGHKKWSACQRTEHFRWHDFERLIKRQRIFHPPRTGALFKPNASMKTTRNEMTSQISFFLRRFPSVVLNKL